MDDSSVMLGELTAKIDMLNEKVDKLAKDVDELKVQRAHLLGVGATVSFCIAGVGFLFGDAIRTLVKRGLGN